MKKYQSFLSENFLFLEVKFSVYLNRRVFVMVKNFCFPFLFHDGVALLRETNSSFLSLIQTTNLCGPGRLRS